MLMELATVTPQNRILLLNVAFASGMVPHVPSPELLASTVRRGGWAESGAVPSDDLPQIWSTWIAGHGTIPETGVLPLPCGLPQLFPPA
jgi:hypothetical protein